MDWFTDWRDWFLLIGSIIGFGVVAWYWIWGKPLPDLGRESYNTESPEFKGQKMLFMRAALDTSWDLTFNFQKKLEERSLEVAKADDRFLVTPDDMKKAYEEVIREEHM